ncbi:unnamed protein product [Commensalibacter communis]|uniref:hypothetical protein n=1 Tax=Commensalibacter communis TaxID=2972786 RepID=UPI0022FF88F9|nr:hypothetical protein [Commensalibacter communis]CAI3954011.1 unnamed protein product [Commensalibacter communis]CAI3958835.1 unnamed protein product [Commensalibacter communis]
MKYKFETGKDLEKAIKELGYDQSSFNRVLLSLSSYQNEKYSLRNIQRNIANPKYPNQYLEIICNLLAMLQKQGNVISDPKKQKD